MNKTVSVSIVTPVYNAEEFLADTIESVLNQTYTDFEYLLVNDCSSDRSTSIIEEYIQKDPRIKLIHLEENSGAAVARNAGIEQAQGRFIAFIDSDDCWYPEKLEKQLAFMTGVPNRPFTYTNFERITEEGEVIGSQELPDRLNYSGLLKNTAIACSTVMIDREIVGDFRMPLKRKGQDTATWLMILRDHDYAYLLPEVLNQYRQRSGSLSDNKWKALARTWDTYRNFENLSFVKASYYFVHYAFNAVKRRVQK